MRGVDLADIQLLSKYNKGNKYLLCATDILLNMRGWFLKKIKKGLVLLMHLKK